MESFKGFRPALGKLAARMKTSKRLELIVYCSMAALAVLLFALTLGGGSADDGDAAAKETRTAPIASSDTEARLEAALSCIRGAGRVKVMITGDDDGTGVTGVIVIASGASDMSVRLDLISAAKTALGVDANSVEVFEMNDIMEAEYE